jgi:hypothetical protein
MSAGAKAQAFVCAVCGMAEAKPCYKTASVASFSPIFRGEKVVPRYKDGEMSILLESLPMGAN